MTYIEFTALEDALDAAYRTLCVNVDPRHEASLRHAYEDALAAYELASATFQEA